LIKSIDSLVIVARVVFLVGLSALTLFPFCSTKQLHLLVIDLSILLPLAPGDLLLLAQIARHFLVRCLLFGGVGDLLRLVLGQLLHMLVHLHVVLHHFASQCFNTMLEDCELCFSGFVPEFVLGVNFWLVRFVDQGHVGRCGDTDVGIRLHLLYFLLDLTELTVQSLFELFDLVLCLSLLLTKLDCLESALLSG
jgi:hypothetical protein